MTARNVFWGMWGTCRASGWGAPGATARSAATTRPPEQQGRPEEQCVLDVVSHGVLERGIEQRREMRPHITAAKAIHATAGKLVGASLASEGLAARLAAAYPGNEPKNA